MMNPLPLNCRPSSRRLSGALSLVLVAGFAACGGTSTSTHTDAGADTHATGGTTGSGGKSATGGQTGSGGASGTGGAQSTGGANGSGGAAGGSNGSGGAANTGGTAGGNGGRGGNGGNGTGGSAGAGGKGGGGNGGSGNGGTTATGGRGGNGGGGTGGAGGQTGACTFDSTYTIAEGGGLVGLTKTTKLIPPNTYSATRINFLSDAGAASCTPALPACHDATLIDVSDVEAALEHPDVKAVFASTTPAIYGNLGVADAPSFGVLRTDGHGFSEGLACTVASGTCNPAPAGVRALIDLLKALNTQQLADPSCSAVK